MKVFYSLFKNLRYYDVRYLRWCL